MMKTLRVEASDLSKRWAPEEDEKELLVSNSTALVHPKLFAIVASAVRFRAANKRECRDSGIRAYSMAINATRVFALILCLTRKPGFRPRFSEKKICAWLRIDRKDFYRALDLLRSMGLMDRRETSFVYRDKKTGQEEIRKSLEWVFQPPTKEDLEDNSEEGRWIRIPFEMILDPRIKNTIFFSLICLYKVGDLKLSRYPQHDPRRLAHPPAAVLFQSEIAEAKIESGVAETRPWSALKELAEAGAIELRGSTSNRTVTLPPSSTGWEAAIRAANLRELHPELNVPDSLDLAHSVIQLRWNA